MYTLGYSFKPWTDPKAIADGPSILKYLNETAEEHGVSGNIRFNTYVKSAAWDSSDSSWTLDIDTAEDGPQQISCNFLFMCSGYYNYAQGYTPDFIGTENFQGQIVHPQFWTEDIDYKDKNVIVIGSGATAVTIVPEMAKDAAHVTMLQRSPTFMASRPAEDSLANWLREKLSPMIAYRLIRWRNILMGMWFFNLARKKPERVKEGLINRVKDELPEGFDVERHFTPNYNPWDQRLCLVTNSDLFSRIKDGSASVVTDHIDHFTQEGIKTTSGENLKADLIVTATGLDLQLMSDLSFSVDGQDVDPAGTMAYKGMMYSDMPNLASSFGYTNASWTLKADLTCEYVCRLLNHMDAKGYKACTPRIRDNEVEEVPWLDFSSGYVQRALHKFPKQGNKTPWKLHQNYILDIMMLGHGKIEDGSMEFS